MWVSLAWETGTLRVMLPSLILTQCTFCCVLVGGVSLVCVFCILEDFCSLKVH